MVSYKYTSMLTLVTMSGGFVAASSSLLVGPMKSHTRQAWQLRVYLTLGIIMICPFKLVYDLLIVNKKLPRPSSFSLLPLFPHATIFPCLKQLESHFRMLDW
ncbi:hypothetical protein C8R47DRAFT_749124 [Mycena vitilis]|nr:hypothetical protein C8R47DRAFT_749124 [Mycena vitilis]